MAYRPIKTRSQIKSWADLENYHRRRAALATNLKDRNKELEILKEIQEYRKNYEGQEGKLNRTGGPIRMT